MFKITIDADPSGTITATPRPFVNSPQVKFSAFLVSSYIASRFPLLTLSWYKSYGPGEVPESNLTK